MSVREEVALASFDLAVLERIDRDLHPFDPFVKWYRPLLPLGHPSLCLITLLSDPPLESLGVRLHEGREGVGKTGGRFRGREEEAGEGGEGSTGWCCG